MKAKLSTMASTAVVAVGLLGAPDKAEAQYGGYPGCNPCVTECMPACGPSYGYGGGYNCGPQPFQDIGHGLGGGLGLILGGATQFIGGAFGGLIEGFEHTQMCTPQYRSPCRPQGMRPAFGRCGWEPINSCDTGYGHRRGFAPSFQGYPSTGSGCCDTTNGSNMTPSPEYFQGGNFQGGNFQGEDFQGGKIISDRPATPQDLQQSPQQQSTPSDTQQNGYEGLQMQRLPATEELQLQAPQEATAQNTTTTLDVSGWHASKDTESQRSYEPAELVAIRK